MIITKYSIVMGVLGFTVAVLIGSFVMRTFHNGKKVAIWLYAFGVLSMLLPVEMVNAKVVRSWTIYPFIRSFFRKEVFASIPVGELLLLAWLFGIIVNVIWLLGRYLLAWVTIRESLSSYEQQMLEDTAREIAMEVGYYSKYQIRTSIQVTSPISLKLLHAYIILPIDFGEYTAEEKRFTLMHEMVHFKKNDYFKKMALLLFCAFFWWNPAVYLFNEYVEQYMELQCDRIVCNALDENGRIQYADTLLCIAKKMLKKREKILSLGVAKKTSKTFLTQRITEVIRSEKRNNSSMSAMLICVLLFLISYLFVLQPAVKAPSYAEETACLNTVENVFILQTENEYKLYENNIFIKILTKEEILEEKYNEIIIYKGE